MDLTELREAGNAGSADATSLLVVIDGLNEAVMLQRGKNGSEAFAAVSPTEYLVAAATALDSADRSHATQLLRVVSLAVPGAHRTVVRLPKLTNAVMRAMDAAASGDDDGASADEVFCRGLEALGLLLGVQERGAAAWSSPSTLRPLQLLLVHYADGRTVVRRAAHAAITHVVREQRHPGVAAGGRSKGKPPRGDAASHVADFCLAELAAPVGAAVDNMRAMRLLQLIRSVAPLLPAARALELCLACVRQKGGAALTAAAMHAVSAIAQSPVGCLGAAELTIAARALLAAVPSHVDVAAAAAFCQAAASMAVALAAADRPAAAALLPETAAALVSLCESPATVVQRGACAALNLAFQSTVEETMVAAAAAGNKDEPLSQTLQVLAGLMQFRYQAAWPSALPLLGRLFLHLRADALPLLAPLLQSLADLRAALVNSSTAGNSPAVAGNSSSTPAAVAAIDEAVGFAIEGCGPERFLVALPLHVDSGVRGGGSGRVPAAGASAAAAPLPAEGRTWLLPLLRERAKLCPCRLAYFHRQLLPLARAADATSRAAAASNARVGGGAAHAVAAGRWVVQIWQLLPSWCALPVDLADAFGALAPLVAKALQDTRYPELLAAACAGLTALADGARERATASPAAEGPAAELEAVRRTTPKYLPILVEVAAGAGGAKQHLWQPLSPERARAASEASTALAMVAPPAFVSSLCKKLVHRLLQATEAAAPAKPAAVATAVSGGAAEAMEVENESSDVAEVEVEVEAAVLDGAAAAEAVALLEVLAALVPSLDETCASLVYRAARPLVRDDGDAALQKHAYRALLALCGSHGAWLAAEERLQDTLELFTGSLLTCHVSARQVRLRCLSKLVGGLPRGSTAASAAATAIIGEVVLCLKDSNARARDGAHLLLLTAAEAATPPAVAKTVVAALGARTPHMRSAAALALAALQQRFGHHRSSARDPDYAELTPQLISTSLLLCSEPSKEVLRATLAFLRVAVGGASREQLEPLLGDIAQAVTAAPPPAIRKSCRAQVKVVLGKLCRKFGFAAVAGLVPDADVKLVEHMRKTAEREVRLKTTRRAAAAAAKVSGGSHGGRQDNDGGEAAAARAKTLRAFDSATGEGDAEANNAAGTASRKRGRGSGAASGGGMRVRERLDGGDVVDLLAGGMMERLGVEDSDDDDSYDDGSDLEVGNDGRLIIPDVGDDSDDSSDSDDSGDEEENGDARGTKRSRGGPAAAAAARTAKEETGILHVAKRQRGEKDAGGAAAATAAGKKRAKAAAPGADYRSRKAGGDVRRKGQKFEPFAYIPLDGRALNSKKGGKGRRGGGEALGQMAAVVRTGGGGGGGSSGGRRGHKPRGHR